MQGGKGISAALHNKFDGGTIEVKKIMTSVLCVLLCLLFLLIPTACSGGNGSTTTLPERTPEEEAAYDEAIKKLIDLDSFTNKDEVVFYMETCGLGINFVREVASDYKRLTGINVRAIENSNVAQALANEMAVNSFVGDIYATLDLRHTWIQYATAGKLVDLTDMVSEDDWRDPIYNDLGTWEGKRYMINYTYNPTGFVYNQQYLDQIESRGEYTKGEFPTTWQGLIDLCEAVEASDLMRNGAKVKGFSWGATTYDMDYIFKALWAQSDYEGFREYYEYDQTDAYPEELLHTEGVEKALNAILQLINPQQNMRGDYYPGYAVSGAIGQSNIQAQTSFINGACVFTVSGGWFTSEMSGAIGDKDYFKFANVPMLEGNTEAAVNINAPGEVMFIPTHANNVEGAKQFLRFMLLEPNLQRMHEATQTPFAFKYDEENLSLSDWGRNVLEVASSGEPAIAGSGSKVAVSGAMRLFMTSDPFVRMAQGQVKNVVTDIINLEAERHQGQQWIDCMKTIGVVVG